MFNFLIISSQFYRFNDASNEVKKTTSTMAESDISPPEQYVLPPTDHCPNNKLPLLVYRNVLPPQRTAEEIQTWIETHGWARQVSAVVLFWVDCEVVSTTWSQLVQEMFTILTEQRAPHGQPYIDAISTRMSMSATVGISHCIKDTGDGLFF